MPETAAGRHQWVVIATYGLTDAEARADEVRLDAEHRLSVDGPACANCEHPWSTKNAARPCPEPWYRIEPGPGKVTQR